MIRNIRTLLTGQAGAIIILSTLVTGCAFPTMMPVANTVDTTGKTVIVVGEIELDPPLEVKFEQPTHWNVIGDENLQNKVHMATGAKPKPVNTDNSIEHMSQWENAMEVELGKTFFLKTAANRTYLNGAMITLDVTTHDRIWLAGGYYFDVPKGAKAIYIGTLKYTRDDFNEIKKIRLINEYKKVLPEFKKKFGNSVKLKKSLLKRLKPSKK